jgi:tripartite-type tricarboxylate transporter receptor subunit TctC
MRSVQKEKKVCLLVTCFLLISLFCLQESLAAPYYEGKVITLVCGTQPGGGYDSMSRLLARYLPKYIPGKPTIIVDNMPGGSGLIAASHIYNVAKPDGLAFGTFNRGCTAAQLLKVEGVRFDMRKFSWIGSSAVESTVLCLRPDFPYKTIEDLRQIKDPVMLAGGAPSESSTQFPLLLKEYLKLNIKVIPYPSGSAGMLAIERKEADGKAGSYGSLKTYIERGVLRPVLRGREVEKGIENLPVNEDLTDNPLGKTVMAMLNAADKVGRPYVAPPGTPAEQMNILREAFAKVAKDPELQENAKKVGMEVEYIPVDECMKVINFVLNQPEDVVKEFGKFVKF